MARARLFTIGYEGRTQSEYLELLRGAGVSILADVRNNPFSRKKGFSKKALAEACAKADLRYEHLPELGIATEKRKHVVTREDFDALFADYARSWLPRQGAALDKLRTWLASGERVALTCYERDPSECHRHCVADALGASVIHL